MANWYWDKLGVPGYPKLYQNKFYQFPNEIIFLVIENGDKSSISSPKGIHYPFFIFVWHSRLVVKSSALFEEYKFWLIKSFCFEWRKGTQIQFIVFRISDHLEALQE